MDHKWEVFRGAKILTGGVDPRKSDDELVEAINSLIAAATRDKPEKPPIPSEGDNK